MIPEISVSKFQFSVLVHDRPRRIKITLKREKIKLKKRKNNSQLLSLAIARGALDLEHVQWHNFWHRDASDATRRRRRGSIRNASKGDKAGTAAAVCAYFFSFFFSLYFSLERGRLSVGYTATDKRPWLSRPAKKSRAAKANYFVDTMYFEKPGGKIASAANPRKTRGKPERYQHRAPGTVHRRAVQRLRARAS